MRHLVAALVLIAILPAHPAIAQQANPSILLGGMGVCLPPEEPYPYKLAKSDPLYDTARDEHQRYLEAMEDYVNCLDRERGVALDQLRTSFNSFMANFGKDAVMKYAAEKLQKDADE